MLHLLRVTQQRPCVCVSACWLPFGPVCLCTGRWAVTLLTHAHLRLHSQRCCGHSQSKMSSMHWADPCLFGWLQSILEASVADIQAVRERDPACEKFTQCILNFKGFQAVQCYRVAHWLWMQGRHVSLTACVTAQCAGLLCCSQALLVLATAPTSLPPPAQGAKRCICVCIRCCSLLHGLPHQGCA